MASVSPSGSEATDVRGERSRVVTLTPAPSIDRVYVVDEFRHGDVNRARHIEAHIGGNGVNLARDLHAAGNAVVAVVPLHLESVLDLVEDVSLFRVVSVPHPTRVNTVIITADGATTNINQAANPLTELDWRGLHTATAREVQRLQPNWVVIGGTIPAANSSHVSPEHFAEIARSAGARLCLDSPGDVVAEWLVRGVTPHLISPNVAELEHAMKERIVTMGDAVDAANRMIDSGIGAVLVSLGERGALFVDDRDALWARTSPTSVVNTTGAGDAALAGLMAYWPGQGDWFHPEEALATAVRWGRAAVATITPTITPDDVTFTQVEIQAPCRKLEIH